MPQPFNPPPPRLMRKAEAAAYCAGMSVSRFGQLVKAGTFPNPVTGTRLWDRVAIDAALDELAGIRGAKTGQPKPLDKWLEKHGSRAA